MNKPILIAFAGLDGAGKTTQIDAIKERFESRGLKVKIQRHFDTQIGKICHNILELSNDPFIRAITFALDEYAQKNDNNINGQYDLILCDRSHYCAIAYSGAQGISSEWLNTIYEFSQVYDLCVYLDISISTSYKQKGLDALSPNFDEDQYAKVRELYLSLVETGAMRRIDAERAFNKVTDDLETVIWEVIKECS